MNWLNKGEVDLNHSAPELELALVRISPDQYLASFGADQHCQTNSSGAAYSSLAIRASVAQALREISALPATVSNKAELMQTAESLLHDARL